MPLPPSDWTPHLGRKLSLRYTCDEPGRPQTELVGVLQAVEGEGGDVTIKVMDRRGSTHLVRGEDIVAAKLL